MRLKYSFTFARPNALSAKKSIDSPINRHVLVTGIRHQSNAWKPDPANAADNSIENGRWGRWKSNWSIGKSWYKQDGSVYCWHEEGRRQRGRANERGNSNDRSSSMCQAFVFRGLREGFICAEATQPVGFIHHLHHESSLASRASSTLGFHRVDP